MSSQPVLRYVVLPVDDLTRSAHFYQALECELTGRDGDAWAGLRSPHVALSLCGPTDARRPSLPALAVTVTEPERFAEQLAGVGGSVLTSRDGHVLITDPDGHLLILTGRGAA